MARKIRSRDLSEPGYSSIMASRAAFVQRFTHSRLASARAVVISTTINCRCSCQPIWDDAAFVVTSSAICSAAVGSVMRSLLPHRVRGGHQDFFLLIGYV